MVNLLVVMVGGDALGRGREFNLAGFAQDLAAERLRETEEAARGHLRQIALLKFLLNALQMLGQRAWPGLRVWPQVVPGWLRAQRRVGFECRIATFD